MIARPTPATRLCRVSFLVRLLPLGAVLVFLLGLVLTRPGAAAPMPRQESAHVEVRTTPYQAVHGYLEAAWAVDWTRAAGFLELSGPRLVSASEGAQRLARELEVVRGRAASSIRLALSILTFHEAIAAVDDTLGSPPRGSALPRPRA